MVFSEAVYFAGNAKMWKSHPEEFLRESGNQGIAVSLKT
jgi:hypothetical protein